MGAGTRWPWTETAAAIPAVIVAGMAGGLLIGRGWSDEEALNIHRSTQPTSIPTLSTQRGARSTGCKPLAAHKRALAVIDKNIYRPPTSLIEAQRWTVPSDPRVAVGARRCRSSPRFASAKACGWWTLLSKRQLQN